MKLTKTVTSSIFTTIAIIANTLAGIYVARVLEPAVYGHYAYYLGVYGIVLLFGSMGLATRVTSAVTESHPPEKHPIEALFTLRILTALFFMAPALILWLNGSSLALAAGLGIGAINLLLVFLTRMLGGAGSITISTGLDMIQAFIYLGLLLLGVATKLGVDGVYLSMAAAQSLVLLIALVITTQKKLVQPGRINMRPAVIIDALKPSFAPLIFIYLLTLLIAALNPLGNFLLGSRGLLTQAAYMNIALTLAGVSALISGSLLTGVYYPRLCQYVNERQREIEIAWVDLFYRFFAFLVIMSGVLLTYYARNIIDLVYTSKYLPASTTTLYLAWANIFSFLSFTIAWSFVANHKYTLALFGATPQFLLLVVGGFTAVIFASQPLESLVLVYLISGVVGWVVMIWLNHRKRLYPLANLRVVLAAVAGFGSSFLVANFLANQSVYWIIALVITAGISGCITAVIFLDRKIIAQLRGVFPVTHPDKTFDDGQAI